MPAAWATTADLLIYAPDIQDYGQTDWSAEIALAQADVREWIRANWWENEIRRLMGPDAPIWGMDDTLLNVALLKPAVCFRALGWEVLPKLAKWSDTDGDSFLRRAEWFQKRYGEELNKISSMALYDWSRDGQFQAWERRGAVPRVRVLRA